MRTSASSDEVFYVEIKTDYDPSAVAPKFGISQDVDVEPSTWVTGEWTGGSRIGNEWRTKAKLPPIGATGSIVVVPGDGKFVWADVDGEREQFDYLIVT
jgi:hypothetical protein